MVSREIIVDSFAGGGGASEGIRQALGRGPDVAINHDAAALAMHRANHPETRHLVEDVWSVDPVGTCDNAPIGLFWMSPDCKHFSKAKGGKPREKAIRGLAWVGLRWANSLPKWQRPRVVILENVEEFQDWGPLLDDGRPCPVHKGATFKQFCAGWESLGYKVEFRELRACDYGAPTIRKRLFWIARRDGKQIVWPERTHGNPKDPKDASEIDAGRLKPWRTAAEIIDWSLPCPSIFETSAEIKAKWGIRANRPLADNTMARVAKGTMRYVVNNPKPFLVKVNHTGRHGEPRDRSLEEPIGALTGHRDDALVTPFVAYAQQGGAVRDVTDPLHTLTASRKDQDTVVAPFVTKFNRGATGHGMDEPLATITAHASEMHGGGAAPLGVVTPFLVPRYGERPGQEPRTRDIGEPFPVIVPTGNEGALAAVHLTKQFGRSIGTEAGVPLPTETPIGKAGVVAAFLAQHNTDVIGHDAEEPVSTIVGKGCTQGLVAAHMLNLRGSDRRDGPVDAPAPTVSAQGNHAAAVYAFLAKYYGEGLPSQAADDPLHTVTTKPRHGVVTVDVAGEPHVIVDVGMRMLTPRERFNAQGFPPGYIIDHGLSETGERIPLTLEQQGRMCGNSVSPAMAQALVSANYQPAKVRLRPVAEAPLLEAAE